MGCLYSGSTPGPVAEEVWAYLDVACDLHSAASSLESSLFEMVALIVVGLIPFLIIFIRGKAGYLGLGITTVFAVYCSFIVIFGSQDMDSEIEWIEGRVESVDGRPPDTFRVADDTGVRFAVDAFTANTMTIQDVSIWVPLIHYLSGCLAVIAGWASTRMMSLRIKTPPTKVAGPD